MEHNILIVEDEKGIRDAIIIYLKNQVFFLFWQNIFLWLHWLTYSDEFNHFDIILEKTKEMIYITYVKYKNREDRIIN